MKKLRQVLSCQMVQTGIVAIIAAILMGATVYTYQTSHQKKYIEMIETLQQEKTELIQEYYSLPEGSCPTNVD